MCVCWVLGRRQVASLIYNLVIVRRLSVGLADPLAPARTRPVGHLIRGRFETLIRARTNKGTPFMGTVKAAGKIKEARIQAVIIRADGSRENLGTVSYYHSNPLKRLWHKLKELARGIARN